MAEARCKTMTMDERKALVSKLVEQFRENEKFYTSKDFVESEARSKFIDPLLEALKWDVKNEKGARHDRQEVITEDRVVIDGQVKHPDYTLCYGGERKIYVEAKQPSVDLKTNPEPALQVRRYAYTSKMPIAILTDFQELAIYDTRVKPKKNDGAAAARIEYLTYTELPQKFEELYQKISWDAVDLGKFDTYWETSRDKKGTAAVDNDILEMIEGWRVLLAEDIALHNDISDEFNLTGAVQKIIDRILFLRICEDKEIEERGTLQKAAEGIDIYSKLKKIFFAANEKFNAGLFASDKFVDDLLIQDKSLKAVIGELYFPECQYEFSVLPVEILGSIYERFLGKIIKFSRKTKNGHSVQVIEKPEVQKAGGVYYTPPYIVHYIVQKTIGKTVQGKTPDEVSGMRFLDPACGSGSFLVGAYQYLLDWHLDYYFAEQNRAKAEKAGIIYKDAQSLEWKLSVEEKKRILLNNIYGVDIDAQAVEVTKLSLFLKLLEKEGRSLSKDGQREMFRASDLKAKILPSMAENIKCGNSLVSSDYYADKDLGLFGLEEQRKVNVFDWNKEFSPSLFDCVIGNPPYVNIQGIDDETKEYYRAHYPCFFKRGDLFSLFIERALTKLSKDGALVSFIVPSVVHTNLSYQKLRDLFLQKNWLCEVCYTGGKVFKEVTIDTTILVFDKGGNNEITLKNAVNFESPEERKVLPGYFEKYKNVISVSSGTDEALAEKLLSLNFESLEEHWTVFQGIVTGNNDAFIFESEADALKNGIEKELLHTLCHGRDIGRYQSRNLERKILYVDENVNLNEWPGTQKWLASFKAQMEARNKGKATDTIAWNRLHRPRVKAELDIKEKIFLQRTRNESLKVRICATLDTSGNYSSEGILIIIPKTGKYSLRALLAILNSKPLNYLFATKFLNLAIKAEYLKQIRIPPLSKDDDQTLSRLAEQRMEAASLAAAAKTDADKKLYEQREQILDDQIDRAVCALYGLTEEEIAALSQI